MPVIRVLLCSERRDDWLLTSAFLRHERAGIYDVHWAGTYQEAERALGRGEYNVFVIDSALGGGRGMSLARAAARKPRRPIIVLTSQSSLEEEQRALAQGIADVVVRSEITPYLLETTIRHAQIREMRLMRGPAIGAVEFPVLRARLDQGVQRARRGLGSVALIDIGLDWKIIEGEVPWLAPEPPWGPVLARVRDCLRDIDTISRTDDGYLILLEDPDPRLVAARAAQSIASELTQPLTSRRGTFRAEAGLGIGVFPNDGQTTDALLEHVRRARELACASGGSSVHFSGLHGDSVIARRIYLEQSIEHALRRGEFRLVYQPQLDLNGRLVGAEALLRWKHPHLGAVSPVEFVPILETTNLIHEVGGWAMLEAVQQAKSWHDNGMEVCVSVNVSAKQFDQGVVQTQVEEALRISNLPPRLLGVELTESVMLDATDTVLSALAAIRQKGVHVAVDDFGTGYASLRYIKRFPMDVIKIDREFVRGLPLDTANAAITNSIVALAHSLSLTVVAEGVETDAEEEFLRSLNCNAVQGYLHSKPLEVQEFSDWYRHRLAG